MEYILLTGGVFSTLILIQRYDIIAQVWREWTRKVSRRRWLEGYQLGEESRHNLPSVTAGCGSPSSSTSQLHRAATKQSSKPYCLTLSSICFVILLYGSSSVTHFIAIIIYNITHWWPLLSPFFQMILLWKDQNLFNNDNWWSQRMFWSILRFYDRKSSKIHLTNDIYFSKNWYIYGNFLFNEGLF